MRNLLLSWTTACLATIRLGQSQLGRIGLLSIVLGCLGLSACTPPTPETLTRQSLQPDEGQPVHRLVVTPLPQATTQLQGGVDWLISRYPPGKHGGVFHQATFGNGPQTFNPWASFDGTSSTLGGYLVAGLLETDPFTGEVVPWLAKSYQLLDQGKRIRVKLRQGLRWSDGHPLTSHDVVFTWSQILRPGLGNPSMRDILMVRGQFPQVRALDRWTVEFTTVEPFAPFLRGLSTPIAPAHVLEPIIKRGGDDAFRAAWTTQQATQHPEQLVACGPWVLAEYKPGERVVYQPNPYFWAKDQRGQRLPYLQSLVITFVKNENNLELLFEQGGLDTYDVPAQYVQRVRHLKRFDFELTDLGPTSASTFLAFNLKPNASPAAQWMGNRFFRNAVDWALDRPRLVANLLKGIGQPLHTPESYNSLYLHPTLKNGHPRNLEKARQLLTQGGFRWNPEGHLLDQQGRRVTLTLTTNSGNDLRESTGVQIQQDLAQLGIAVFFRPVEFNVLVNRMHTGDWQLMVMGLSGGSTLEPHFSANVWRSDGALHLMNQRSPGHAAPLLPWERQIDALFDAGVQHLDFEKRAPIYYQYQEIVAHEDPMVYLYAPRALIAIRHGWRNVYLTPLGAWHNLEAVWYQAGKPHPPTQKISS